MPILIPSKNIYNKQNPKIRDNSIDKIEVTVKKVNPYNEYKETVYVYSSGSNINGDFKTAVYDMKVNNRFFGNSYTYEKAVSYLAIQPFYCDLTFSIKRSENNSYIQSIFADAENLGVDIIYKKMECAATALYAANGAEQGTISDITIDRNWKILQSDIREDFRNNILFTNKNQWVSYPPEGGTPTAYSITSNVEENFKSLYNNTPTITVLEKTDDFYKINIKMFAGYIRIPFNGVALSKVKDNSTHPDLVAIPLSTTRVHLYQAQNLEFTFKGNKLSIDLSDDVMYVGGTKGTKVFSVEGNELMQENNYYVNESLNAITRQFQETIDDYKNGKETATIRCSISDYYYYIEGANENKGLKVISADNSTGKMSFKMYDQVIPMVYGADGKDRPMSLYQDGTPKVFQVLGSKIYYDGAVWQELSLQEVDKRKVL